jgi:hypothetical protein
MGRVIGILRMLNDCILEEFTTTTISMLKLSFHIWQKTSNVNVVHR